MRPRLVVGLTGGIASGKSTVADLFINQGITVIDADILAREAVEPGRPALTEIAAEFGPHALTSSGTLDRARLRERVFADPEARRRLEEIVHPWVRAAILERLEQADGAYCVLCIPLLLESNQEEIVDRILVVDVPEEVQIQRVRDRDGSSRDTIEGILAAQVSRRERLAAADDVIDNDGELESLRKRVAQLHHFYLDIAERCE